MNKSSKLQASGMVVILASLAFLVYERYQKPKTTYVIAQTQYPPIPCGPNDKLYKIYKVPNHGKFCLEKVSKDWIKNILKRGIVWEKHIVSSILQYTRKGSTAVDVGAHIGTHTLFLSKAVGEKGQVIAFEPQTKIYQELLVNLQLNEIDNVRANMTALGPRYGYITMEAPKVSNEGNIGFSQGLGRDGNIVEVRSLDSYNLKNVSIIKIDVEGAENMVLNGAKQTIIRNQPVILIEIIGGAHRDDLTAGEKKKMAYTMAFLKDLGYVIPLVKGYDYVAMPKNSKFHKALQKRFQATTRKAQKSSQTISKPSQKPKRSKPTK